MRRGRSFAYLTEPYQGRPVTLDPGRPLDNHIGRIGVARRVDPSPPLSPPPPSAKVIIPPNVLQNEKPRTASKNKRATSDRSNWSSQPRSRQRETADESTYKDTSLEDSPAQVQ